MARRRKSAVRKFPKWVLSAVNDMAAQLPGELKLAVESKFDATALVYTLPGETPPPQPAPSPYGNARQSTGPSCGSSYTCCAGW